MANNVLGHETSLRGDGPPCPPDVRRETTRSMTVDLDRNITYQKISAFRENPIGGESVRAHFFVS